MKQQQQKEEGMDKTIKNYLQNSDMETAKDLLSESKGLFMEYDFTKKKGTLKKAMEALDRAHRLIVQEFKIHEINLTTNEEV